MNPKVYVGVLVEVSPEGQMKPIEITWEDGRKFSIDRVIDVRRAASLKAGGQGMRFTCLIRGKETYLFKEEERWFMERKGAAEPKEDKGESYSF